MKNNSHYQSQLVTLAIQQQIKILYYEENFFFRHHQTQVPYEEKHFPIHQMKPDQYDWQKLVSSKNIFCYRENKLQIHLYYCYVNLLLLKVLLINFLYANIKYQLNF